MNFLSRDLVFVFPDDGFEMIAFFENLLNSSSTGKLFKGIPSNIVAALNIEFPGDVCSNLDSFVFKSEGSQTRPFLDLLNTLTKISDFHGLSVRFENQIPRYFPKNADSVIRQFFGSLNYGHKALLE